MLLAVYLMRFVVRFWVFQPESVQYTELKWSMIAFTRFPGVIVTVNSRFPHCLKIISLRAVNTQSSWIVMMSFFSNSWIDISSMIPVYVLEMALFVSSTSLISMMSVQRNSQKSQLRLRVKSHWPHSRSSEKSNWDVMSRGLIVFLNTQIREYSFTSYDFIDYLKVG